MSSRRSSPSAGPPSRSTSRCCKDAGLVSDAPDGTRRIYGIDPDGVGALRAYLDRFWNRALAAFKDAVEQEGEVT